MILGIIGWLGKKKNKWEKTIFKEEKNNDFKRKRKINKKQLRKNLGMKFSSCL